MMFDVDVDTGICSVDLLLLLLFDRCCLVFTFYILCYCIYSLLLHLLHLLLLLRCLLMFLYTCIRFVHYVVQFTHVYDTTVRLLHCSVVIRWYVLRFVRSPRCYLRVACRCIYYVLITLFALIVAHAGTVVPVVSCVAAYRPCGVVTLPLTRLRFWCVGSCVTRCRRCVCWGGVAFNLQNV